MKKDKPVKICALYGRVSTDDKLSPTEHGSLEQQEHLGREVAVNLENKTGIKHVLKYVLIEPKPVSGGHTKRPQYQKLIELITLEKIDVIISKEISRLSRSTADFCALMTLCKDHNVAFHVRGLEVDPTTPMGSAMFQILAVISEFERQITRERTKSSIRSSMLNNQKINGGSIVLGFNRNPEKKGYWIPNKDELKQIEFLMKTFVETTSYKATVEAAKKHKITNKKGNKIGKSDIKRLLTNPKYIGRMKVPSDRDEEIWVDLPHGQVIPVELFEQVQATINLIETKFKSQTRERKRIYVFSGLVEFEDGSQFQGHSGTSKKGILHYYYKNPQNKITLPADEFEKAIFSALRIFENDSEMISCAKNIEKETFGRTDTIDASIKRLKKDLNDIDAEESALMSKLKLADGSTEQVFSWLNKCLTEMKENRNKIKSQVRDLEEEKAELLKKSIDPKGIQNSLKILFDGLMKADPKLQKGMIRQLFKSIKVFKDNRVEICWNLPTVTEGKLFVYGQKWRERRDSNSWPSA